MLVYQRVNSGTIVVNFVDAQLGNHGDTQQKNIPIRLGLTWFDQGRREGTMGIQPTSMNYIVIELFSYTYIYIYVFSIVATVMGFIFTVTSLWATTMVCSHS